MATRKSRRASRASRLDAGAARAGRRFARLVRIMATLRSPAGCPWDRRQTARTLRPFLLEETYEALDAIDRRDLDTLRGELGDVLFQCVFQAQLAAEAGRFDIGDSVGAIIDKLIRRHPHVFTPSGRSVGARRGQGGVRTAAAVVEQWEQLKSREQQTRGAKPRLLAGVPKALPALLRAHEIGTRAAAVGFDWPSAPDVMTKVEEEVGELRAALGESPARAAEELGDLLFALANLARKLGVEPESALREANDKFTTRFAGVEDRLDSRGRTVHTATLDEMEAAWAAVKSARAKKATTTARGRSSRGRSARPSRP